MATPVRLLSSPMVSCEAIPRGYDPAAPPSSELEVGALLPCNVIVYEDGQDSVVSAIEPHAMLGVVENPDLEPIADEVRERLERALRSL